MPTKAGCSAAVTGSRGKSYLVRRSRHCGSGIRRQDHHGHRVRHRVGVRQVYHLHRDPAASAGRKLTLDDIHISRAGNCRPGLKPSPRRRLMHQLNGIPDCTCVLAARGYQVSDTCHPGPKPPAGVNAAADCNSKAGAGSVLNSSFRAARRDCPRIPGQQPLPEFLSTPRSFNRGAVAMVVDPVGKVPSTKPCHMRRALVTGPSTRWAGLG